MTWGRIRGGGRVRTRDAVTLTLVAAFLAACGGAKSPEPSSSISDSSSPSVSPSPTVVVPPAGYAPLTGLPMTSAAAVARPIVAVAVAIVPGAAAPKSLGSADLLYQEFDRTGRSRVLALYQSADAQLVGPVADTAPVDIRLLAPMAVPVYAFVGGPTGFVAQARADVVTPRSALTVPALFHSAGGLFTSTSALRASAPRSLPAPPGLLSFDAVPAASAKGATKVTKVTIAVPGQPSQSWAWSGKAWIGPGGLSRTNLVIQTVLYKTLTPSKGAAVASATVIGNGASTVLAANLAVKGTWGRPALLQTTSYADSAGLPFSLQPGPTLVLLVPAGTKVTLA